MDRRHACAAIAAACSLLGAASCGPPRLSSGDGGSDAAPNVSDGGAVSEVANGAALYRRMCASCHGEAGEGGRGPRLQDWSRGYDALRRPIGTSMPSGNPAACTGECPDRIASFIMSELTTRALACDAPRPSQRRVRRLTRGEYRNTVRDLLGVGGAATQGECNRRTFAYFPAGRTVSRVSLAGSFNDWSADRWPMTFDAAMGAWVTVRDVPDGTHQYKFVLNGTEWVRDERNPMSASDGFGGQNSVLVVACGASMSSATGVDVAANLPPDARASGGLFDNDATVNVVTSSHVSEYLRSAKAVVDALGDRVTMLPGCDIRADRPGCGARFVREFGARVFRRPLSATEQTRYDALVQRGADPVNGLRVALRAMLVSPSFMYRTELGDRQPDGTYKLTGYEVASALSYGLWGTTPDAALASAAADGTLATAAGIEREARRLVADPRARGAFADFAVQWLRVEPVATATRNMTMFPSWSESLRGAMMEETRRFVTHVVFDGTHRFGELYTADYSFVNAELAGLYGIAGVTGTGLQRAQWPSADRAGVLGMASVLARYAHSDQTSPIQRGVFVRVNLLCQDFAPPPANAGGVPDVDPRATTRARFAMHTSNPACSACHRYIDDVGFGFEGFDAIGRARTTENGATIDRVGSVLDLDADGGSDAVRFATLRELGVALAASESARGCFARQYFRYARGYQETLADRCGLQAIQQRFRSANDDVRELMVSVFTAPEFATRRER
jgi:mono/diheme cytochrome c family protein